MATGIGARAISFWCSRHQFLYKAEELTAAGISEGTINSLAWDVVNTGGDFYSYIDISMRHVLMDELEPYFVNNNGQYFHTNFKLNPEGETVFLYTPEGTLADEMAINVPIYTTSIGLYPDGNSAPFLLQTPTPGAANKHPVLLTQTPSKHLEF